jgi:hypothetical protein
LEGARVTEELRRSSMRRLVRSLVLEEGGRRSLDKEKQNYFTSLFIAD